MNPKDAIGASKPTLSALPLTTLLRCGVSTSDIHPGTLYMLGAGMYEGARKYGRHNYRAVEVCTSVYYDAAMRHLSAIPGGEEIDPDSGLPHLIKAATSLLVIADALHVGNAIDNRPPIMMTPGVAALRNIRDRLAMWWDGVEGAELHEVIGALVRLADSTITHGGDWMYLATCRHKAIVAKYPDPKPEYTR